MYFKIIKPVFETYEVHECPISPDYKIAFPPDVVSMFGFLKNAVQEHFIVVHLDGKNAIVCFEIVSIGLVNRSLVHPREVFKSSFLCCASAVILIHNHPSGNTQPSQDDHAVTRQLKEAGRILGIKVLDHIIIGDGYYSFLENGQL